MPFILGFLLIHFTAVIIMSYRKTDNLFGCYVVAWLVWLLFYPVGRVWIDYVLLWLNG